MRARLRQELPDCPRRRDHRRILNEGRSDMADKLDAGATFPDMTLQFTDGSSRNLPTELDRPWTLVLFYRGHW